MVRVYLYNFCFESIRFPCRTKTFFLIASLLGFALLGGCGQRIKDISLKAIVVKDGETVKSLAEKHYGDKSQSWRILEFNDIKEVTPGQEIVIPLRFLTKGGISPNGYQTIPVLTYHNFSNSNRSLMMVTGRDFERQMSYLHNNGYTPVSIDELFGFLEYKQQLPQKAVVITFDDGWKGVYTIAYPILKKYGFKSTLFVYTDLIRGNRKTLSWKEVQELRDGGVDIQCHTKSHLNLTDADKFRSYREYFNAVQEEIVTSTRILEEKLGKKMRYMAYPYGDSNSVVIALLKKEGYKGAFTVNRAGNPFFQDRFLLNRSMVYGTFSLKQFKRNLRIFQDEELHL